jgi:glycosyltransferase involved in cell wall biosynthesis
MKILFVSVTVPHSKIPTAGGLEIYNYIKGLAKNHQVDLVSAFADGDEEKFKEMSGICSAVYHARRSVTRGEQLKQVLSWVLTFCRGPLKHRPTILLANDLIRKNSYDIVQIEFAEAGLHIKRCGKTKLILDAVDVNLKPALRRFQRERSIARKVILFFRLMFTKWFEGRTFRNVDLVLARSEYDKDFIKQHYGRRSVSVLRHIVNSAELKRAKPQERAQHAILFTGAFQRDLNVESARFIYCELFPPIKKQFPDASVIFAGANPPREMLDWAARDSSVMVTGFVDSLFEYYFKSTVFVAPMFIGGGVITKIIEAMFCGCPVVTTDIGNEGIGAEGGKHIMIANNKTEFIEAVSLLFKNEKLKSEISESARQFAQSRYEFDAVIASLEDCYGKLAADGL